MTDSIPKQRLLSLDLFRGLIMVSLLLGETEIFQHLEKAVPSPFFAFLSAQFEHSAWHGVRFWDLLLPAFMLLSGTSMAYSYHYQSQRPGFTWNSAFIKVLKRCGWLLFWGVLVYAVRDGHINLQFSNVLCQLSFATLAAFLTIRSRAAVQFTVSLLCLLIPELLYRFSHVPGFDQPFVTQHNFGNYIDLLLIGHVNGHYSPAIDCIPCTTYVIWGMMAGNNLLSQRPAKRKVQILVAAGLVGIAAGLIMDLVGITPLLKWLISSSFVMVTGGFALFCLGMLYHWVDVRKHQRYLRFFLIVGMNSIFIYLIMIFIAPKILHEHLDPIMTGLFSLAGIANSIALIVACVIIFALEWLLCYFLYRKKLFFKL